MARTIAIAVVCCLGSSIVAGPASAAVKICNDSPATVHVAFASQTDAGFTAAGWWSAAPGACAETDFPFVGTTLFYAGDSDAYRKGRNLIRDHWGNKVKLYVASGKFSTDDAAKRRRGTRSEMFSSASIVQPPSGKTVDITVRFKPGSTSIQSSVPN